MASAFAALMSMGEHHIAITGRVTSFFLVGASLGSMTVPWLIGQSFESVGAYTMTLWILATVVAASVALADAGIPMRDLVSACAAGKVDGHIVLDLCYVEDEEGEADMPVAYMPKLGQITLLQMDGLMTREEFDRALRLAIKGCEQIYEVQREALKRRYEAIERLVGGGGT